MLLSPPAVEHPAPYVPVKRALLCIDRVEQNGRLNIVPTYLRIASSTDEPDHDLQVTLLGGQNACFRLGVRRVNVTVRFTPSSLGPSDRKIYWTASFPVTLRDGTNEYVLDDVYNAPRSPEPGDKTGWHRLWQLQPIESYCRTAEWFYCDVPERR